ncbi:MAG: DUF935 family protein [Akkermansiaceae bacterium]|nr:DUF935 family protein [Armatimonadota bacterium]
MVGTLLQGIRNTFQVRTRENAFSQNGGTSPVAAPAERVPLRVRTSGGRVSASHYEQISDGTYPPGGLDTFRRMERDGQIRACLTTKRLSVLSETAQIRPGDDSPDAKRAADSARTQLNAIPGGVAGLVTGALDALSMGYAVGELVFAQDGTLAAVKWHDPRRFAAVAGESGDVVAVELLEGGHSGNGVSAEILFPASRFVWYTYQKRYGNPYGESDLVAAYRSFAEKDSVRRMWLQGLDRFGVPTPVATVPTNWTQKQIDELSARLGTLQSETSIVVPHGVTIGYDLDAGRVEPARAYLTKIEYEDTQIARAILGQDMTTQGATGSLASARVHADVLCDWVQSLRSDIAQCLSAQVAARIAQYTVGYGVATPVISFPNLSPAELAARRELVEGMITGQVVAPTEMWIRDWLGIPESVSPSPRFPPSSE